MRLLNTTTLELCFFIGDDVPPYAILSHRWENEDVTFQDLQSGKGPKMIGFAKIEGCCRQAKADGLEYAWIDSCCINKQDFSELSESINSMFRWYEDAQMCYAYLSDVPEGDSKRLLDLNERLENEEPGWPLDLTITIRNESFYRSKWFTRGWTLQELLAPDIVIFYDQRWVEIGTKSSLNHLLRKRTGIFSFTSYKEGCIAQKFSWAADRETAKVEDRAYSLMGIMGVNMPLLYGEGEQAFVRLQMEILKFSDDESIFAWPGDTKWNDRTGLLATSPDQFRECGDIFIRIFDGDSRQRPEYFFTNKGLKIEMDLYESRPATLAVTPSERSRMLRFEYLTPLNCQKGQVFGTARRIALRLIKASFENKWEYDSFYRMSCVALTHPLLQMSQGIQPTTKYIYTPQLVPGHSRPSPSLFSVRFRELFDHGFRISDARWLIDKFNLADFTILGGKAEFTFKLPDNVLRSSRSIVNELVMLRFRDKLECLDVVINVSRGKLYKSYNPPRFSMLNFRKGRKPRVPKTPDTHIRPPHKSEISDFYSEKYGDFWQWCDMGVKDRIRLSLTSERTVLASLKRSTRKGRPIWIIELTFEKDEGGPNV